MAIAEENAPRRAWVGFAKIRQAFRALLCRFRAQARPQPPGLKGLSDHLARDIGLTAADLEEMRHKWPSETMHHPRG